MHALDSYLHQLDSVLGDMPPRARAEFREEARQHLLALVAELQSRGLSEADAVAGAIAQFGDAGELGRRMRLVHPRAPLLARGMLALACCALVAPTLWLTFGISNPYSFPEPLLQIVWLMAGLPFCAGLVAGAAAGLRGVAATAAAAIAIGALAVIAVALQDPQADSWWALLGALTLVSVPLAVGAGLCGSRVRVRRHRPRSPQRYRPWPTRVARGLATFGRRAVLVGATLALLMYGLLGLTIVPAPGPGTAVEVTGRVARIERPHPDYGDMAIYLRDGGTYYVNRANEVDYFAWQRLLRDVKPGDAITLTVGRSRLWPLLRFDFPNRGPVAGVRTGSTVYMDAAIAAQSWPSIGLGFVWTGGALLVCIACFVPELGPLRRRPIELLPT